VIFLPLLTASSVLQSSSRSRGLSRESRVALLTYAQSAVGNLLNLRTPFCYVSGRDPKTRLLETGKHHEELWLGFKRR
jgi:hypothetical protein